MRFSIIMSEPGNPVKSFVRVAKHLSEMGGPMTQPPSDELFVSGLPTDVTDDLLKKIFSQYGSIKEVKVLPVAAGKQAAAAFRGHELPGGCQMDRGERPTAMFLREWQAPVTVAYATPAVAAQGHEGWHEGNDGNDGSDDVEHEWPGQRRRLGRR